MVSGETGRAHLAAWARDSPGGEAEVTLSRSSAAVCLSEPHPTAAAILAVYYIIKLWVSTDLPNPGYVPIIILFANYYLIC